MVNLVLLEWNFLRELGWIFIGFDGADISSKLLLINLMKWNE